MNEAPVSGRWRDLLAGRVAEATRILGAIRGVDGLIVGGSVGRGEAWPMSDIDILPIYAKAAPERADAEGSVGRQHAELIDWWAASGRAQTLDVGGLAFSADEVARAHGSPASWLAAKMGDRRWFHGIDKASGGYGGGAESSQAQQFVEWATAMRFAPEVIAARVAFWRQQARDHHAAGQASLGEGDHGKATLAVWECARAVRLVLIEGWGQRLSSMGREWTRFERMAEQHDARDLATRIAALADADPGSVAQVVPLTPLWLQERIDLALAARRAIDEEVSAEENARDQIAAFRLHVLRGRPALGGEWLGLPAFDLTERFAELRQLLNDHCQLPH